MKTVHSQIAFLISTNGSLPSYSQIDGYGSLNLHVWVSVYGSLGYHMAFGYSAHSVRSVTLFSSVHSVDTMSFLSTVHSTHTFGYFCCGSLTDRVCHLIVRFTYGIRSYLSDYTVHSGLTKLSNYPVHSYVTGVLLKAVHFRNSLSSDWLVHSEASSNS